MIKEQETFLVDLSSIGLANAASAFSMMSNDRVTFKAPAFNSRQAVHELPKGDAQILFTPFIGEVLFESYLIVPQDDAAKIASTMLPASMASKPEMAQTALLELDNIISASIATKFSDLLSSDITGDVPRAYIKSHKETEEYIAMRMNRFDSHSSCHTRFKLVHTKAQALFIFLFKESFGSILESLKSQPSLSKEIHKQASHEARRFLG